MTTVILNLDGLKLVDGFGHGQLSHAKVRLPSKDMRLLFTFGAVLSKRSAQFPRWTKSKEVRTRNACAENMIILN